MKASSAAFQAHDASMFESHHQQGDILIRYGLYSIQFEDRDPNAQQSEDDALLRRESAHMNDVVCRNQKMHHGLGLHPLHRIGSELVLQSMNKKLCRGPQLGIVEELHRPHIAGQGVPHGEELMMSLEMRSLHPDRI